METIPKSNLFKSILYFANLIFIVFLAFIAINPELISKPHILILTSILAISSFLHQYYTFKDKNNIRNKLIILTVNIIVLVIILTMLF